ncbi:ROK family protein [Pseudoflavonifractor sp. MSJ-30]|uniref:ROK family protein n=1 Tax=Pseudoflavonifractor sp. MSJ-30 TaxID=2841525 RepID=UPI001C101146|nr:ROK family protein [Pseudoflavonifractor sp. MSJ-30]
MNENYQEQAVSNMSVRRINRVRVLKLLFRAGSLTQMDIKNQLGLSGPTVTQALQFFTGLGLLREGDEMPSSGGRRPRLIEFRYDAFYSAGVEIRHHHVDIQVIDLRGTVVVGKVYRLVFENTAEYWQRVNALIKQTVAAAPVPRPLLGVGIAFPGEISVSKNMVSRSTVLACRNIPLNIARENVENVLSVEYGASAAGFGVVWREPSLQNAVYIVVTNSGVAGSVIVDNRIYRGTSNKPGAFGHIVLDPNGLPCFCGGRGCWSAYCSLRNLTQSEEPDLERFFTELRAGSQAHIRRWEDYLNRFAQALANISLSFDTGIVIGGKLAPWLEPYMEDLRRRVADYPVLSEEELSIRTDTASLSPIAEGVALTLVSSFLDDNLEGRHFDDL